MIRILYDIKKTWYNWRIILISFSLIFVANGQNGPLGKEKSVLFVYGGWEGHEPEKCRDLFVPWLRDEGFKVTVSLSLDSYLDEGLMNSIDLVIQIYTMSSITEEQEKIFFIAVRDRGVAISGWHRGLADTFTNNIDYQFMIGG